MNPPLPCRGRSAAGLLLALLCTAAPAVDSVPVTRMPGQLVDIGTHRLHLQCEGEGGPAVVLEAGLGGTALEWRGVQGRLAGFVRACTYDRAGYGWSNPGPLPRTSGRIADELYMLLHAAGIDGPYVLVGHSFGGYVVELFARRYPELTAGLVLVDASHPEQVARFRAPPIGINTAPRARRGLLQYAAPPGVPGAMPEGLRAQALALSATWRARQALAQEFLQFEASGAEVLAAGPPPPVPTVVLTRGRRAWPEGARGDMSERLWLRLQDELADMSPRSAHLIATGSGHHIHVEQPELVADAVTMVIDFARQAPLSGGDPASPWHAGPTWLAFAGARWRHDTLHPAPALRATAVFLPGAQATVRAGHIAGTARPDQQLILYYD